MVMHNFLPHTPADRDAMLTAIGLPTGQAGLNALFSDIPASLKNPLPTRTLPQTGMDESSLQGLLTELAAQNGASGKACFMGGGAYARFIPMAVNSIASRSEFYTAYTPYQPEMSQGTLQVGFEFQTMIAELTGMDAANASVYDGGVAVAEAAMMAHRITKKTRFLTLNSVHPHYRGITQTYVEGLGEVSLETFATTSALTATTPDNIAAVIVQQPNFFGGVEDIAALRAFCDTTKAILIVSCDPISLGVLEAPGKLGADIVVGDIQPLGNNLSYGGPYGGFMATKTQYMRQLPGRLVGMAKDKDGRPCYTLTMQTREQHIRREKATSNICTNQALNILKATVYLTLVGPQGLKHLANLSIQRTHSLVERLTKLPGVTPIFAGQPYVFECAINLPKSVDDVLAALSAQGILGGVPLKALYPEHPNGLLVTCTELTTPEQMDRYVTVLSAIVSGTAPVTSNGNGKGNYSAATATPVACSL
ncbi:MAG: aminomethyl-transferring glycine dehydrogenase subunit GcvPA [Vampirovibrionales bacterium]